MPPEPPPPPQPDSPPPLQIDIIWRLRKTWRALTLLKRVAEHTAAAEGFHYGHLSVVVAGKRMMTSLHKRFMNLDKPTDVLTFDMGCDSATGYMDAEIILCADVARQRVGPRGSLQNARAELALYLVHGLLHLSGYDDHTPAEFNRMHAREDELLVELGLGTVFHNNQ